MLRQTFIHLPGVGRKTERELWLSGISCWEDFVNRYDSVPLHEPRKTAMRPLVEESIERLDKRDHAYFARALPKHEYWRTFSEFGDKIAYLDIETTGLFPRWNEITVIGLYDGKEVKTYISGKNMADVERELEKYSVIVTFNGARFDIPFIQSVYPQIRFDHIHIDLVYPLRRLGYKGGLKSIERQTGIERESDISSLTGFDAIRLWNEYKRGNAKSLETLVKYNSSDIVNLKTLMEFSYERLRSEALKPDESGEAGETGGESPANG